MQNVDWSNLSFGWHKTDYNVRSYYRNGKWGELEISSSDQVNIHICSTVLHYGQEIFEGTKAFRGKDGKVRLFRWQDNLKRMNKSANGIMMPSIPEELFEKAIKQVVTLNKKFIPPYGSGASLYIRPIMVGTGIQIGVKPADEYLFLILVTPVGPYFKEGFKPVDLVIYREFDRAAPQGTGNIKVGGNYAASLVAGNKASSEGYAAVLYLDSKEKKYIDECGPANFLGIKNNTYITPKSNSILPSITNKCFITLAEELGMKVERREIPVEELETFQEVGACGTAAVLSPVKRIYDNDLKKEYLYCKNGEAGEFSVKLYNKLRSIQYGDEPDKFGWIDIIEGI